jgi:hypothetical protein
VTAETGLIGIIIFASTYLATFIAAESTRRRLRKARPLTGQVVYAMECGAIGFFIAAIFGSMAHVSFLVLHVITMWCILDLMRREAAGAAAARRAQAIYLMQAGPPMPATR